MSKILKSLDLFSTPFFFNIENNQQKRKTAFGGLVSIAVFSLSLAYFTYICYLYSNNKIDPTVNQTQKVINEDFFMTIQNSILAFQIYLPNGQNLDEFQTEKGKRYVLPTASYKSPDPNNNDQTKSTNINLIKCKDPDLATFYCFDFTPISSMENQMDIGYDANILGKYSFEIVIIICDASILDPSLNCASQQQFRQDFLRISTSFTIKITTQYYNTQTKQLEKFTRNQLVSVSDGLTSVSQINLLRTNQQITQGFLLQQRQSNVFFSDYDIRDIYFTKQFIFEEYGSIFNILTVIQFQIGNIEVLQQIQYPLFTYVLAQFASVFNVLLIFGIVGQLFSQNQLILDFAEVQLKSYFKASAYNILKQINISKHRIEDFSLSKHLTSVYFQIKNKQLLPYFNKYLNINIFKRIKILIMAQFFDQSMQGQDSQQIKLFKELINETQNQISITELQQELMQMKIIIRLLLSKEQFAAIQLCGYFINSEKELLQNNLKQSFKDKIEQNPQLENNFQETIILKKETNLNQIEENKKIGESYSAKSDKKYNQVDNCNNLIQKIENTQDNNDQKESKHQKVLEININDRNNNSYISENNQLYDKKIQQKYENHLDALQQIEKNQEYFESCIQKFLDKKLDKSELDKRILGCMIGFDQQELG
ncbi:phosphatidylserine decarboxylase family protein (macronuclear) [Tetrahymena thermophila SB210]|uniref:Phosphatidylserine decarboxylase family protein n=1 Tax=Tetrahymena thermophila (strain SB210) TaxID=312017 RepID=Q23YS6_TETTS|nr:phosphatidylserine decarboxylase family protein [Tetrahymena thermophila SB210]EAS01729.2 phosphatidylserine decarboxylase family protein [Tetrahymena thermophila SB210]|eukprot:XP_001021974.2 phosphatidylserine decarboxylase family protein [Tetrahymena thermophila SB210]